MIPVLALVKVSHPSPESMDLNDREEYIKSKIDSDYYDRITISDTEDILFKITIVVPKKIARGEDRGLVRQYIQRNVNPKKNREIEILDFEIVG